MAPPTMIRIKSRLSLVGANFQTIFHAAGGRHSAEPINATSSVAGRQFMYKLLRNFSVAALISFLAVILVHTYIYYQREMEDRVRTGELKNIAASQVLRNSLSHVYAPLFSGKELDDEQLTVTIAALADEVARQIEGTDIVELELYNRNGDKVFSTTTAAAGYVYHDDQHEEGESERVQTALQGTEVSVMLEGERADRSAPQRHILEGYLPIRASSKDAPIGVLELYSDITREMAQLRDEVTDLAVQEVITMLLLYAALFLIVRRADGILHSQHQQLVENVRELKEAKEAAEAGSRTKMRFLASMSHEIRTPMAAVIGLTDLLLRGDLKPKQREQVQTIGRSGELLQGVIEDILDFSKMESGRLELETLDFDVAEVVDPVVALLRPQGESKGLQLSAQLESADVPVRGDSYRLRQILVNLVGNAIKFTERGEVVVRTHAISEDDDRLVVRFEVCDTGIGIAPEDQEGLFEAFQQADASTVRRFGGSGLGLTICKLLVEQMGGEIGVDSEAGRGSTFWFELPFEKAALTQATVSPDAKGQGRRRERRRHIRLVQRKHNGPRVLVAEDNLVTQQMLVEMLEELGCEVSAVGDGYAVLSTMQQALYDMVLLDCQMPGMDGYAVARELCLHQPGPSPARTVIIAITADATADARQRCLEAGMDDYLSKPVRLAELAEKLEDWVPGATGQTAQNDERNAACASEEPLLDPDVWEELRQRARSGRLCIDKWIELFTTDTQLRLARIAGLLDDEQVAETSHQAHALQGACRQLGASRMVDCCARLQSCVSVEEQRVWFKKLREEYISLRAALALECRQIAQPEARNELL